MYVYLSTEHFNAYSTLVNKTLNRDPGQPRK